MFDVIEWMRSVLESAHCWWQGTFTYNIVDGFESFIWGLRDSITDAFAVPINYLLEETIDSLAWLLEFMG